MLQNDICRQIFDDYLKKYGNYEDKKNNQGREANVYKRNPMLCFLASIWNTNNLAGIVISVKILGLIFLYFKA